MCLPIKYINVFLWNKWVWVQILIHVGRDNHRTILSPQQESIHGDVFLLKSLRPSDTYNSMAHCNTAISPVCYQWRYCNLALSRWIMCQRTGSSLVQVKACHLFGKKSITWINTESLTYYSNFNEIGIKAYEYLFMKIHLKVLSAIFFIIFTRSQCVDIIISSPPSAAYMHQWIGSALVQIMACPLFGTKPLSKPMLFFIINWTLKNILQWNFNQNKLFFHENASENIIYKMAAILSRRRWVNLDFSL